MQDKYNRILIDKLPKELANELEDIKASTENFSDEEIIAIEQDNFDAIFKGIQDKYPEALKAKKKLIKPGKAKITKKAEPKKKIVKKDEAKKKLKKVSELPCDDAKDELKKIESKKAKAAKARAEAPKKKVSTAAREKQVKALSSLFKTKNFKDDKNRAKNFTDELVSLYSKFVSNDFANYLQEDIDALIKSKYQLKKMNDGGQLKGEGVDLFEDHENIPENVQSILDKHSEAFENGDYKKLEKANKELKKIGYTFEYGLDGTAYDLRKIGQKGKTTSEMMDSVEIDNIEPF